MSVNEWKARVDLAAIYRLTDYYGWTSVVYNHITLRIPDTDTFLINPFGLRYDEINASNLIKIDLEGHELPALKGMLETLKKIKPAILIEILNNQDQASEKLLKELGYEKFFIDDHGNLSQTNNNSNRRNYLFIFPN